MLRSLLQSGRRGVLALLLLCTLVPAVRAGLVEDELTLADAEDAVDTAQPLTAMQRQTLEALAQSTTDEDVRARALYSLGRDGALRLRSASTVTAAEGGVRVADVVARFERARQIGLSPGRLQNVLSDLMHVGDPDTQRKAARDYLNMGKNLAILTKARAILADSSTAVDERAVVGEVRHWSNPNYTRIIVYTSRTTKIRQGTLPADPANNKPPRLYVDVLGARLASQVPSEQAVGDGLLTKVRVSQNTPDSVRIVLDFVSMTRYNILQPSSPAQIIIDVLGEAQTLAPMVKVLPEAPKKKVAPLVIIDAGHGGKDPGALGPGGAREKKVTLKLAQAVAAELKKAGFRTQLTRDDDTFIELFDRTALANKSNADLFISVHADSAKNKQVYGFTTYFLAEPSDRSAQIVAARENDVPITELSEVDMLKQALTFSFNKNESKVFAEAVHDRVVRQIRGMQPFKDHGVKSAPFYVMYGAQMPSILIESGFISNAKDAKKLQDPAFVRKFAQGVREAVQDYFAGLEKRKL